jgi:hypothetical protein
MKTIVLFLIVMAAMPGLATAQTMQLQSITEIDCSAYQRQTDGTWIVLKFNKVLRSGKVAREVFPGDDPDPARLTNGTSLHRILNAVCAPLKR